MIMAWKKFFFCISHDVAISGFYLYWLLIVNIQFLCLSIENARFIIFLARSLRTMGRHGFIMFGWMLASTQKRSPWPKQRRRKSMSMVQTKETEVYACLDTRRKLHTKDSLSDRFYGYLVLILLIERDDISIQALWLVASRSQAVDSYQSEPPLALNNRSQARFAADPRGDTACSVPRSFARIPSHAKEIFLCRARHTSISQPHAPMTWCMHANSDRQVWDSWVAMYISCFV